MKLSISKDVLLNNLNILANGLPTKTPMPALTGIKLQAIEGGVILTASKSDVVIRTTIVDETLEVETPGEILVSGKIFTDVMRKVNSKNVTIYTSENNIVLSAGRGTYQLNGMDVESYPNFEFEQENSIKLNSKTLLEMIKTTMFSAAQNEKRPILTGVNFKISNGELIAVATDSYRLSQCQYTVPNLEFNPITVPSKSLNDLMKCIGDYDGDLDIVFTKNKMYVSFDNVEFQTRLLDGNYPDVSKLIQPSFDTNLKFNRNALAESIDRVALMSPSDSARDKEITYSVIRMIIKNGKVLLSSTSNALGTATEEMEVLDGLTEGLSLNLAFSGKYFAEALKGLKGEECVIHLANELKPFIITEVTNDNIKQLILPVRM